MYWSVLWNDLNSVLLHKQKFHLQEKKLKKKVSLANDPGEVSVVSYSDAKFAQAKGYLFQ